MKHHVVEDIHLAVRLGLLNNCVNFVHEATELAEHGGIHCVPVMEEGADVGQEDNCLVLEADAANDVLNESCKEGDEGGCG